MRPRRQRAARPTRSSSAEALFYLARHLAHLDEARPSLDLLDRAVAGGFCCYPAMATDPWLESIRKEPAFTTLLCRTEAQHRQAETALTTLGGQQWLGVQAVPKPQETTG